MTGDDLLPAETNGSVSAQSLVLRHVEFDGPPITDRAVPCVGTSKFYYLPKRDLPRNVKVVKARQRRQGQRVKTA